MSLTRHILTSSAQLTIANAVARAAGIISLPLLTHWLAPAAYGEAALASTLISLVSVIGLMGMDMSYARSFLSRTPPNGMQVETFCWRFAVLAALVAGTAAAIAWWMHAWNASASMPGLALLVFVGASGSLLLAMAQTRSRLHGRHARLAVAVAIGGIAATAITLALARWLVADERALVAGYVTAYVLPILIMGIPGWRQLRAGSGLEPGARKAVLLVGLPGVVTAPMYWILSSSDRWFLQASTGAEVVGVYAVACTFGQLGMMVNSALLAIWLPEATRLHESDAEDSDQQLAQLIVRLILMMAIICMGVSILGSDMLRWLSAEKFHQAVSVVPTIAVGVFFYGCYHIARTGMFLRRSLGKAAFVSIAGAVFSLGANALLVPKYGMKAAAVTQAVSFAVIAASVMFLSQRHHPLPLPMWRLLGGVFLLLLLLGVSSQLHPITSLYTAVVKLAFIVMGILLVAWVMDSALLGLLRRSAVTLAGKSWAGL